MSRDYNEVFEIKKVRRKPKFIIFLVVVLSISTIAYFVYMFISKEVQDNYDIYYPSYTYYAVSLESSKDKSALESLYPSATALGASGYVWEGEQENYLIALIYPTEDMAKSVVASNEVDNFELEIIPFSTPNIAYNLEDFEENEIELISESTMLVYDLGKVLYELTIAVQIGNLSSIAGASTVNNYKGDILANIAKIENILQTYKSNEVVNFLEKLVKLGNVLEKLVNDLITNNDTSNSMKYSYCEYIYELCNI